MSKFKAGDYIKPNVSYIANSWHKTNPDRYVNGKIMVLLVTGYGDYILQATGKETGVILEWSAGIDAIDNEFDKRTPLIFKYKKRA